MCEKMQGYFWIIGLCFVFGAVLSYYVERYEPLLYTLTIGGVFEHIGIFKFEQI